MMTSQEKLRVAVAGQLNYQQGERGDDRGDDPQSDRDLRVVV